MNAIYILHLMFMLAYINIHLTSKY